MAGSYDAIARPIFGAIKAHRLLLEYDDERSGSFDPLALVRDDKRRVIDLERLALGTQCGFSTSVVGNRITVEDERRKLWVIARTAALVWPSA